MSQPNEHASYNEDNYTEHTHPHSGSSHHHSSQSSSHSTHHHSSSGSSSHHHSSESSSRSGSTHHHSASGSSAHHHYDTVSEDERKRNALVRKYQVIDDEEIPAEKKPVRHHHSMRRSKKIWIAVLCVPLALLLAVSVTFAALNLIGKKQVTADESGVRENPYSVTYDEGKTVVYNGQTYALNENIVTVAAMGVDREEFGLTEDKIGTAGQADVILIGALDLKTGDVQVLMIPRDSMVDVDQYTVSGQYVGVDRMQVCLSFAYGDGGETSCQNVLTSTERILYGIPIHLYGAMDLSGISTLNDAVGGVTVTPPETFGKFIEGQTVTLYGDDAEAFVRSRNTAVLDSDTPRRARQVQYLQAFVHKAVRAAVEDIGIVSSLYNAVSEYAFTNVSLSKVTYLATTLLTKGVHIGDIRSLTGELVDADPYPEYNLDEQAAFEAVLDTFYTPVEA